MTDRYTDGEYLAKNPSWHVEDSPYKAKDIVSILRKNNVQPNRVAEVGCGAGEILVQLEAVWPHAAFEGYEVSPQAFALAKERERSNIRFACEDFTETQGDPYDVVLLIDVVEHIQDYYGFLRSVRQRGEYKVYHVPLEIAVVPLIKPGTFLKGRYAYGHIQYFTKDSFLEVLRDTEHEIIDWTYTRGVMDLKQWSRTQRILNVFRRALYPISPDIVARILGSMSLMVLAK